MSTGELATATGIEQERIKALEAGRLDPDYELLLTLAEGLGVGLSAIIIRADELKSSEQASGGAASPG